MEIFSDKLGIVLIKERITILDLSGDLFNFTK